MTEMTMIGKFLEDKSGISTHSFPLQVYWEDTDAGGIVYYANYLKFTERARTDFLRGLGINQQEMMSLEQLTFVVRDCQIEYLKPAKMDDSLEVRTTLTDLKGATLMMHQDVIRQGETLIKSDVRVACLNKLGRPARFSPQIRNKFSSIIQSSGAMKE